MTDYIKWPCDKVRGDPRGYEEAYEGDGLVMLRLSSSGKTVQSQVSPALRTQMGGGCGVVVRGDSQ